MHTHDADEIKVALLRGVRDRKLSVVVAAVLSVVASQRAWGKATMPGLPPAPGRLR